VVGIRRTASVFHELTVQNDLDCSPVAIPMPAIPHGAICSMVFFYNGNGFDSWL
jgi:hypothetical protein